MKRFGDTGYSRDHSYSWNLPKELQHRVVLLKTKSLVKSLEEGKILDIFFGLCNLVFNTPFSCNSELVAACTFVRGIKTKKLA